MALTGSRVGRWHMMAAFSWTMSMSPSVFVCFGWEVGPPQEQLLPMPNALVGLDVWTYLPLCVQVSVSGLGRCEVDLQHLYLGHVAVDSWRYPGTGMDASYRLTGHSTRNLERLLGRSYVPTATYRFNLDGYLCLRLYS